MNHCAHCGLPIPARRAGETYCCSGCEFAAGFLRGAGLERFYALRGERGIPATGAGVHNEGDLKALGAAVASGHVSADVQGMHCAGCVWLIEALFERHAQQPARIDLDPAAGSAELHVSPNFDLRAFAKDLNAVGYQLAEPGEKNIGKSDGLLWRVAVAFVLAGNAMFFSIAVYLGLETGEFRSFLDRLSLGAGALSVWIAAPIFIQSSWQALRRGIISMDLPVALGIVLSFSAALWRFLAGHEVEYLDTLAVFVALVLLGRWLQERAIERNRNRLMGDRSPGRLKTRRVEHGTVRTIACSDIETNDRLLIGPGELVPVDMCLERPAHFSLDWINGESESKSFRAGETVPAGAFHHGSKNVTGSAQSSFGESRVPRLLRRTRSDEQDAAGWWVRVSAVYTILVIAAAVAGALYWMGQGEEDLALRVTTAVLIVTCPCAIGIAIPLARAFAHATLRESGLYVRTKAFLERLHTIERVIFDKTGTLTTGALRARATYAIEADHDALRVLAALSQHPKSVAIAKLVGASRDGMGDARELAPSASARVDDENSAYGLERGGFRSGDGLHQALLEGATEHIGRGVEGTYRGTTYRLGSARWACGEGRRSDADVVFTVDGEIHGEFRFEETLREDARENVLWLAQRAELAIASGDAQGRVERIARSLAIADARGELDPEAKADMVREGRPAQTLMIGDGLNDHLALLEAGCAGTPAVDRPFVASRCDFYIATGGLLPLRRAFEVADWMRRTQRALLAFAFVYNLGAVALAWSGAMSAWMAAVLMPLSSLLTLTLVALSARRLGRLEHSDERDLQRPSAAPSPAWTFAGSKS